MRSLLAVLVITVAAQAHGGSFRGRGAGVPPGGLPSQPQKVNESGGAYHTWLIWWGYNQFKYLDYRNRQAARRGPVSGTPDPTAKKEDPNAWRGLVRKRLTPLMLEALKDADEEVRTAAAVALGKWQVGRAIPDLQKMRVRDKVKQVRESALLGLILMRDPKLHDYLRGIARDGDEQMRMRGFAMLGLGMADDQKSQDYLFQLLNSRDKKERPRLPTMDKHRRQLLCAAIAGLTYRTNPALGPELLQVARDKRLLEEVRAYALAGLGKVGARNQIAAVIDILKRDKSTHLRRSAAIALGELATPKDADALEALRRGIKYDKDRIVGHFCTISLGQIGGPLAFTFLSEGYPKANKEARGFFLMAFGLSKEPGGVPILKKALLTTKDARDRAAAALALGLVEDKRNAAPIRDAFDKAKDWLLMQTTMLSLGILDHKASAEPIKDVLITRKQPAVRVSAAISYALLRQWSAVSVFTEVLGSAKSIVTLSAIAQVMGFLASEKVVDPLVELYKNKNLQRQARAFALVALGALGDPEPLPILMRMAFGLNYMIRSDPVDEAVTIL